MTADIVNLRRARKQQKRREADAEAARNRVLHGQSGAQRRADSLVQDLASRRLDGHRLTTPAEAAPDPDTPAPPAPRGR